MKFIKTFSYSQSRIINAPLPEVKMASLKYPYFVTIYSFKKGNVDNKIINVEVGTRFLFLETKWSGTGVISEKMIDYTQTSGLLKNLNSKWIFQEEGDKTKLTIDIKFNKNIILGYISLNKLSKIVSSILEDLDKFVTTKRSS